MGAILNPATIQLILQAIQAAIAAAPEVVALGEEAKKFITGLFSAGVITKQTQDACHLQVDAWMAQAAAGIIPDSWKVQPDPAS